MAWTAAGPGTEKALTRLEKTTFGWPLPPAYRNFLLASNGGEGEVGYPPGRIRLWTIEELTRGVSGSIAIDGFFMFGTDGAGTTFGITESTGAIVTTTASGVFQIIAPDFETFAAKLGSN